VPAIIPPASNALPGPAPRASAPSIAAPGGRGLAQLAQLSDMSQPGVIPFGRLPGVPPFNNPPLATMMPPVPSTASLGGSCLLDLPLFRDTCSQPASAMAAQRLANPPPQSVQHGEDAGHAAGETAQQIRRRLAAEEIGACDAPGRSKRARTVQNYAVLVNGLPQDEEV